MKNILKDSPQTKLIGRLKYTTEKFVQKEDIKGKDILNIGCGYGWFELWSIKQRAKKITGIEIDEESLSTAKSISDSRANFKIGSAINLPFKDNTFDTVVSWEVLEHIPKKTEIKMFSEVNRVLKNNGNFYLSTPNSHPLACLLDPAWWLIGHRHYSKNNIRVLAQATNFSIKKITLRGRWIEIIFMLNLYFSKWVLHRKPLFEKYFTKLINTEYDRKPGFTTIFVKMEKLKK